MDNQSNERYTGYYVNVSSIYGHAEYVTPTEETVERLGISEHVRFDVTEAPESTGKVTFSLRPSEDDGYRYEAVDIRLQEA